MDREAHWENVYRQRLANEVSWYQAEPTLSLALIGASGIGAGDCLIDVGGGTSTLVDHLLVRGHTCLSVLDLSATALAVARARLGAEAARVEWLHADITRFVPPRRYALWHDRAVFHFLTDAGDRRRYVEAMAAGLAPGAQAIIATFAEDGPAQCSQLDVVRYTPATLAATLGPGFTLAEARAETHTTPAGKVQSFIYCRFRRLGGASSV